MNGWVCDLYPAGHMMNNQEKKGDTRLLNSLSLGKPAYIYIGGCPLDMIEYGTECACEVWRNRPARSGHHVLKFTLQTIELFR